MSSREETIEAIGKIKDSAVEALAEAISQANITLLFGNGGSYALASHIAADITKVTKGKCLAVCPMDSTPGLTAWSNDKSYAMACLHLAAPYEKMKPFIVSISTSGGSANMLHLGAISFNMVTNPEGMDVRVAENVNLVFMHEVVERLERDHN